MTAAGAEGMESLAGAEQWLKELIESGKEDARQGRRDRQQTIAYAQVCFKHCGEGTWLAAGGKEVAESDPAAPQGPSKTAGGVD